jgi:MFS family permease
VTPERSPWAVLAVSLLGVFSVGFTVTLLAIVIPTIAEDLGTEAASLTWIVTGPTLAFGVVGPIAGKLGDLHGHKLVGIVGLVGSAVFAVATALAWDPTSLIAFRVLGAAIGAGAGPASIALVNQVFDPERRVSALGWWNVVGAGGPVLGAVIGAPVVDAVGWRVVFWAQAPLCLAAAAVAWRYLPDSPRQARTSFDVAGAATLTLAATSFLFGLNRGQPWGWTHPLVIGSLLLSPLALAAFTRIERRVPAPLFPIAYARQRNVAAPIGNQLLANFAYMGGFVLTPQLLERGLGYGIGYVTVLVIARPLAFSLTGPLIGTVTRRIGERRAGFAGGIAVTLSMVVMSTVGEGTPWWVISGGLALSGIGLGISSPAMGASVASAVRSEDFGIVGAMQLMVLQIGAAVGIQVMSTVQQVGERSSDLVSSFGPAFLVGAASASGAAAVALMVRDSRPSAAG